MDDLGGRLPNPMMLRTAPALLLGLLVLFAVVPAASVAATTPTARGLSSDNNESCVVRPSAHVVCWGPFGLRQSGTYTSATTPRTIQGVAGATQVAVGQTSACARLSAGSVACWGDNRWGQLGDGTTTPRSTAVTVVGLADAIQVTVGTSFACARKATSAVVCWGQNESGELGNGTTTDSLRPVAVSGLTNATQISAANSYSHVCARRSTGAVACWGINVSGVLGDGTTTSRSKPVAVKGLTGATQVSVGQSTACARRSTGAVSCWGAGGYGQLGNGTTTTSWVPVAVSGLADATQVYVGSFQHVCGRRATGAAVCWGLNDHGQLGDGTKTNRSKATAVKGLTDASEISADFWSSCALRVSGAAVCWGDNAYGELGDGTTVSSLTPHPVAAYPADS